MDPESGGTYPGLRGIDRRSPTNHDPPDHDRQMGFLARLIGLDHVVRLLNRRFDRLEHLVEASAADKAAMEHALETLQAADTKVDKIAT